MEWQEMRAEVAHRMPAGVHQYVVADRAEPADDAVDAAKQISGGGEGSDLAALDRREPPEQARTLEMDLLDQRAGADAHTAVQRAWSVQRAFEADEPLCCAP